MNIEQLNISTGKLIIKKCHCCGHVMESDVEVQKCGKCKKSFLPNDYFKKVHSQTGEDFKELFSHVDDLNEQKLVKGIHVIW